MNAMHVSDGSNYLKQLHMINGYLQSIKAALEAMSPVSFISWLLLF